jgi:hypothetical protein
VTASRIFKIAIMLATLAVGPWSVMAVSSTSADQIDRRSISVSGRSVTSAWSMLGPVGADDNTGGDNDSNSDNDDGGENSDGGDNDGSNNNNNTNNNSSGNDNGNGGGDGRLVELPPLPPSPSRVTAPRCTTPGKESVFLSADGKASVRVFSSISNELRVTVTQVFDLLALPPLPGPLAGLLIYDVAATSCGGGPQLAEFPVEVNLNVNFTSEDIYGLNGQIAAFSWLDPETNSWQPVEKQSLDLPRHAIGATITRTGRYIVYEDP